MPYKESSTSKEILKLDKDEDWVWAANCNGLTREQIGRIVKLLNDSE